MKASGSKSHAAFTLIEMLVVISVITLLCALFTGGLARARQKAMAIQSTSNLHQLTLANLAYAIDHGHYAPVANRNNTIRWCGGKSSEGIFDPTLGYMADYLGPSRRVTACPLFTKMLGGPSAFELGTGGYGYNDNYIGGRPEGQSGGKSAWKANGDRVSATPLMITQPTKTVMFTTSAYANGDALQEYPYSHPPYWDFGTGIPNSWNIRPSPSTHFRFGGYALVGWCDGHITKEPYSLRDTGYNPHHGDADAHTLGWFGPDENNGYWNTQKIAR
ncbi:type II secretion system protein [Kiritimatiellota bacterium B12222]|nr:type II secretion system protein [Kiritimatiellota bacterium B12222]